jgi:hypothetical protein
MTGRSRLVTITAALWLAAAGPAAAQVFMQSSDRPAIGLTVGRAGAALVDHADGPMWDATFEAPAAPTWRLRGELGRARFTLGGDMVGSRFPDKSRMTRLSMSLVRVDPRLTDSPVRLFVGAGPGVYRFTAHDRSGVTRFGLHGLAGMEIEVHDRTKIVGEVRLDLLRSGYQTESDLYALHASAVAGVRWTWKERWTRVHTR